MPEADAIPVISYQAQRL